MNQNKHLVIADADSSDTGIYQCSVINKVGNAEKLFHVKLMEKPQISKSDDIIEVVEGSSANLECLIEGNLHNVSIEWKINDRVIQNDLKKYQVDYDIIKNMMIQNPG